MKMYNKFKEKLGKKLKDSNYMVQIKVEARQTALVEVLERHIGQRMSGENKIIGGQRIRNIKALLSKVGADEYKKDKNLRKKE